MDEKEWLRSDNAVIKAQPLKEDPILAPQESDFVDNSLPESEQYLSDAEILKIENSKLVDKQYYNAENKKYFPRLTTDVKVGYPRHIVRPQVLFPLTQTPLSLTYVHFITMLDSFKNFEVNVAFGLRKIEGDSILGGYIFYDHRITQYDNRIHQTTLGFEYLCNDREARINIYIPFITKFLIERENYIEANYSGTQTYIKNFGNSSYEVVRPGFDIEVGGDISNQGQFSAFIKPFFFYHWNFKNIYGLSARMTFQVNTNISLNTEVTFDNGRKFAGFAGIKFVWLFGSEQVQKLNRLELKMNQMPIRDIDAITTISKQEELIEDLVVAQKVGIIDSNTKSSGSAVFKNMNRLNHSSDTIDDICTVVDGKMQGIEEMSNKTLEKLELASLSQEKIGPASKIEQCLLDPKDTREQVLKLQNNMDQQKQVAKFIAYVNQKKASAKSLARTEINTIISSHSRVNREIYNNLLRLLDTFS